MNLICSVSAKWKGEFEPRLVQKINQRLQWKMGLTCLYWGHTNSALWCPPTPFEWRALICTFRHQRASLLQVAVKRKQLFFKKIIPNAETWSSVLTVFPFHEVLPYEIRLSGVCSDWRRCWGDPVVTFQYLKGAWKKSTVGLFTRAFSYRTKGEWL